MRFWRKLKKDQRGMTLTEIMLGFAILAILMVLSLSIMLFSSRVFSEDGDRDRLKMLGDEMYLSLSDKITFVTHIQILPEGTNPSDAKYKNVIFVKDGRLYTGPKEGPYKEYYSDNTYQKTQVSMTTSAQSDTVLSLKLTFTKGAGSTAAYETSSSIRLINLAAGTDSVIIERPAGPQKNPIISYDEEPYHISESGQKDPVYNNEPYTVKCYAEGKEILPLENGRAYKYGDIVEYDGHLWQVLDLTGFIYDGKDTEPGSSHNQYWRSLEEDWETVNAGQSGKSAYSYHDVVMLDGTYYMCTNPYDWPTNRRPQNGVQWVFVYWFDNTSTTDDRMLGWSLTKDYYTSVYTQYPKNAGGRS